MAALKANEGHLNSHEHTVSSSNGFWGAQAPAAAQRRLSLYSYQEIFSSPPETNFFEPKTRPKS